MICGIKCVWYFIKSKLKKKSFEINKEILDRGMHNGKHVNNDDTFNSLSQKWSALNKKFWTPSDIYKQVEDFNFNTEWEGSLFSKNNSNNLDWNLILN